MHIELITTQRWHREFVRIYAEVVVVILQHKFSSQKYHTTYSTQSVRESVNIVKLPETTQKNQSKN